VLNLYFDCFVIILSNLLAKAIHFLSKLLRVLKKIAYFIIYILFVFVTTNTNGQLCNSDSNYYSFTYNGGGYNFVKDAIINEDDEVVALCQYDAFSSFVSKFTAQGSLIWSKEFSPNYQHTTWVQYPWYNETQMLGIASGLNDTYYTFGFATEHGKSINNVEDPPTHRVGLLFHFDKYGNKIGGKYFGNWRTDYSVSALLQLADGNLIVYLRSHFTPKISKVLCVNLAGEIIWATPIQCNTLIPYNEIDAAKPVIQKLANGNIVVARIMQRNIADTIQYPFQPPIIIPAPLHYFNFFEFKGKDGQMVWENSYQCPTLTNTNVSNSFIPQLKNITQLPNGNLSFAADMYLPLDTNERFYANKVYNRRAANFITNSDGYNIKLISYYPANGACNLEKASATGNNGEQLFVTKDAVSGNSLLFKIDAKGVIIWSKAYVDNNAIATSQCVAVEKKQGKGYFIFQSDPKSPDINAILTNVSGNTACAQASVNIVTNNGLWPWLTDRVRITKQAAEIDFRYSPFVIKQDMHTLRQYITCQYQFPCCKDFIDSLNPRNVSICENETFTLPDNYKVKDSGQYYARLKTIGGCDSVLFYNIKVLKLPANLTATPDTCIKNASSLLLSASEGYSNYLWNNNFSTPLPYFSVNAAGIYSVKVENKCGVKTDTIQVYAKCDFPIYFPNAFTPNNDFLNDVLKVPQLNKNKFRCLTIYNRYGQIVFKSTDLKASWDGKCRGIVQENGAYSYYLQMEGFSGKVITQKGTVVLIR
jgi:gliding motility-associated-like protein